MPLDVKGASKASTLPVTAAVSESRPGTFRQFQSLPSRRYKTAIQTERVLGVPAHVWLGLEREFQHTKARRFSASARTPVR